MKRSTIVPIALSACCFAGAVANGQVSSRTLRLVAGSTFTDHGCNGPCACIIDPIPFPIGGRIYVAPAPSIPDQAALAGHFRFVTDTTPTVIAVDGPFFHSIGILPGSEERITLTTDYASGSWALDNAAHPHIGATFPNLDVNIASARVECTILYMHLNTVETCAADFDNGSALGVPDGAVTIDDLLFYLRAFEEGLLVADVDDGSALGFPDQAVGIEDLIFMLNHFEGGC